MSVDWQPGCSLQMLHLRAKMLQNIRKFFAERSVLEVETPLLGSAIGTDPQLDFFTTTFQWSPMQQKLFLQTSPEFAMKRLLASGSGSIYQICKAFRNGESGRFHNPEFTMLEWYRVGYSLPELMSEIDELMMQLFDGIKSFQPAEKITYQAVFKSYTNLDPIAFSYEDYAAYARNHGISEAITICGQDQSAWLDFIFSHHIQPHLGWDSICLIYGYPACFSSLARVNAENSAITDRVELFIQGVELGNGYYELGDFKEQSSRFDREIAARKASERPDIVKDNKLLAALEAGLPDCSGIAIGLDRVLMLLSESASIDEVLSFSISRA
ncbi:MAG: EF-P lysine aminoacylase GenX [Methylococcaceae bacterium]|nr:EF-P lysine aminoacylase GenX [Methylococcaceae bacterium]